MLGTEVLGKSFAVLAENVSLGEYENFRWCKSLFLKTCLFAETTIWPSLRNGSLWGVAAGGGCYLSRWLGKPLHLHGSAMQWTAAGFSVLKLIIQTPKYCAIIFCGAILALKTPTFAM